ncbi:SDR family oxidoreductase [Nocardia sp. NPDC051787]|uniref:SDR family oxidoreductase n=1 Tax=Nocardia sp. NPDC051787 TaxID=3155415 RepID=UPI00344762E4
MSLTDRVAVLTGASRGLGKQMVLAFAEAGADVVIASRKLDGSAAVADIATAWPDELRTELTEHNALRRVGEPDEVVGSALFFATDASTFCTGATLAVDGCRR